MPTGPKGEKLVRLGAGRAPRPPPPLLQASSESVGRSRFWK